MSFAGHKLVHDGVVTLDLECKDKIHKVKFHVVDTASISIICEDIAEVIGLIKRIYQIENNYREIFKGLGCIPGEYTIKIDKTVQPVIHPPRKVPISLKEKVKCELDKMIRLRVITKRIKTNKMGKQHGDGYKAETSEYA